MSSQAHKMMAPSKGELKDENAKLCAELESMWQGINDGILGGSDNGTSTPLPPSSVTPKMCNTPPVPFTSAPSSSAAKDAAKGPAKGASKGASKGTGKVLSSSAVKGNELAKWTKPMIETLLHLQYVLEARQYVTHFHASASGAHKSCSVQIHQQ
ncbi:hypothetical protein HDU81_005862 [Chytriomyces hyalinus]|nr:hypothetical protein HDU81_005862 [Chytriomyces hyalinus]